MKNIKELLPIGSIVQLKGAEKKLMVAGVLQTAVDDGGKEYDYFGLLFPEGHIGNDEYEYLFNHDDIDFVAFRGYDDGERKEFIDRLANLYEKSGN